MPVLFVGTEYRSEKALNPQKINCGIYRTVELRRIKDALEQTGKGNQFAVACAASLLLMIVGCVIAIMIDNPFLVPVFAIAFAMIPFIYAKRTVV